MFARFFSILLVVCALLFVTHLIYAADAKCNNPSALGLADVEQCSLQLTTELNQLKAATKPLEGQLGSLQRQLAQIQSSLDILSANIISKQKDLRLREEKLVLQQALLEKRVRSYYIRSYLTNPLIVILSSINSGDLFRELSYSQSVTREDKQVIT